MKLAFTIAAEAANVKAVTVQLRKDTFIDRVLGKTRALELYLSSDAAGLAPVNAATTGIVPTLGTAGELLDQAITAQNSVFRAVTDATGKLDLVLTNAGDETETVYLNVIDPASGNVHTSGAVAFADDTP